MHLAQPLPRTLIACALLALWLCSSASVHAQSSTNQRIQKAIASYEAVRDDAKKRGVPLRRLHKLEGAEVRDLLFDELMRVTDQRHRAALADALGAVQRDGVVVPLEELLVEAPGSSSLRRAAAKGLARQGEAGLTALVDQLNVTTSCAVIGRIPEKDNKERARLRDIRVACVEGLALVAKPRAWDTLGAIVAHDGSASSTERSKALHALRKAEPSDVVTKGRFEASEERKDLVFAAQAARQMAEAGDPRASDAIIDIHKETRKQKAPPKGVLPELLHAMVPLLEKTNLHDRFLRIAATASSDMAKAVDDVRRKVAKYDRFQQFLQRRAREQGKELERCAAIRLATFGPDERTTDVFLQLMRDRSPAVVYVAARAIGERGDASAIPSLQRLLSAPGGERRLEALHAIHGLQKENAAAKAEWESQLLEFVDTPDRAVRTTALDFLADLESEKGLAIALAELDDRSWPVRAAAYNYCKRVRSLASVAPLIQRVDAEDGRLKEDVLDTLQSLTARRYPDTERWHKWWSQVSDSFELVPADALAKKKPAEGKAEHKTVTYYDIPLVSHRVSFVVDTSGSMDAKIGTDRKRSRLDEAKRQLRRVVSEIPRTTQFNVVFFSSRARQVFKVITNATEASRKSALETVEGLKAGGGTNIFEALERAFDDQDIDTVYLLSDGYPSAGKIQDASALADEVARWNRTRQVRIHCIAIGSNSAFLRRLAEESGGTYAHFR